MLNNYNIENIIFIRRDIVLEVVEQNRSELLISLLLSANSPD